jgi:N6-adenosine-specific RNA methylase IME4
VKYRTIVADPPWDVGRGPDWGSGGASRALTYSVMDVDAIAALPVREFAESRAHLYLWTIERGRPEAPQARNLPNGLGLGGAYSLTTEHVLFARRGVCRAAERIDSTWWEWSRGAHSAKPEAFMDMVERVSPAPRLELFARRQRLGWDTWGDEALEHVQLEAS